MRAFLHGLWRAEPILHSGWELTVMRVLFALLLWDTQSAWAAELGNPEGMIRAMLVRPWTWDITTATQPHPNGLALWFDLTWLSVDWVEKCLRLGMAASLLAYIAGVRAAYSLLVPTAFGILAGTLGNSQGAIGHTAQPLHQVLLGIWLGSVVAEVGRRRGWSPWRGMSLGQMEAEVGRQVLIAGYVVSGMSKLIESKAQWFLNARYLPIHMVKNNDMKFYQTLDEGYLKLEGLSRLMLEHPLTCQVLFGVGLPLELFAFVGLRNRRLALLVGGMLFAFHWIVNGLMSLFFFFNMGLLLTFMICPWWWLAEGVKLAKGKR